MRESPSECNNRAKFLLLPKAIIEKKKSCEKKGVKRRRGESNAKIRSFFSEQRPITGTNLALPESRS
jgi:hypothetical protein